jgi:hemolysin activation/secretion protein
MTSLGGRRRGGVILGILAIGSAWSLTAPARATMLADPAVAPTVAAPKATASYGRLRGIAVLARMDQFEAKGADAQGVNLERSDLHPRTRAAIRKALAPLVGQPLNDKMLLEVRTELEVALTRSGDRFDRAIVPPQDVTGGTVQVVLLKGRLGKLSVTGAKWFSASSYRQAVRVKPGQVINASQLDADIDWINQNPFRHAQVVVKPGDQTGLVDVTVQAVDQPPLRLFTSFDNTGTRSTNYNRWNTGVTFGDVASQGVQASFQHSEAPDFKSFASNSGSVIFDLPWRNMLIVSGSEATLSSLLPPPLNQTGYSSALSIRYEVPLANLGPLSSQNVSLAFDYKNTNTNLLFAQIPVFGDLTEIGEWTLAYAGTEADRLGASSYGASLIYSPGNMFARDTNAAFAGQRTGAQARFAYINLQFSRTTHLPRNFALVDSVQGQLSSGNLLGTEELAMGGAGAIRGYDPDQVFVDEGVISRNELRAPPMRLLKAFNLPVPDQLQPFVFGDFGEGFIHSPLANEKARFNLASTGLGLYYTLGKHFTVAFDYGWQLLDPGLGARPRTSRSDISAALSF